ncbi:MAG: TonB-dependent copper receptor [Opitutaceae bacterium]|nr:TonB-dependent copper receptor [Opitutaceae bacterium]
MKILFALALPLTAGVLAAQSTPASTTSAPASAAAAETEITLAPLVVTGASSEQPLIVTLDPRAPAQPMPAQDGADVLKAVPGFSVIRKGGTDGDPVLRGMAGSRLIVALDDQCVLGGCGNRMDPPTAYVFPAAYDKVTILKGPQTVLHGPGNSAGVVLFESERDRRDTAGYGGMAAVTAASFGRLDAVVDARAGTPEFLARGALTRTEGDDYEDGDGRAVHAAHERWSANASLGWTPDARTLVEISGARSDGEAAYADRMMDGVVFDRENLAVRARREQLTPLVASLELQLGYNYVDHVMDNYSLRTFAPSMMMPNPAVSNPDRETTGGRLVAELTPGGGATRVTLGLDQQSNRHTVRSSSNQSADPYQAKARTPDAEFSQWGVFGEMTCEIGEAGRVVAGARLDQWRAEDHRARVPIGMMGSVPNPSYGHVRDSQLASGFARYEHRLSSAPATLYAGLGYVSRFPDYWELIKNESATSVTAFGTMPEKTMQLDLGANATLGALDLAVAVFASDVQDFNLVQSSYAKPSGMMGTRMAVITRNVDASTWGGEVSAGWRFAEHWRADASLAYTHGTNDTDDRPLAQIPPLESRLALAYTQATWSIGGLVRLVADQDRVAVNQGNIVGQDIGPSEGFAVVSLNASWRLTDALRLSAGADNLLDETYAEHISRAGSMLAGYPQTTRVNEPGRVLWLKLDLAY